MHTTFYMLNWVVEHGYDGEESFQKYHARKFAERELRLVFSKLKIINSILRI